MSLKWGQPPRPKQPKKKKRKTGDMSPLIKFFVQRGISITSPRKYWRERKEIREAGKSFRELYQRPYKIYPSPKPMRAVTKARALGWRARNFLLPARARLVTSDYKNFYSHFARQAKMKIKEAQSERRPVIILVGGIAGAGKTTIAKRLDLIMKNLYPYEKLKGVQISLDSYFKPRAKVKVKRFGREREVSKIGVREVKPGVFKGGRVIDGEFDNPRASDLKRARSEISVLRSGGTIRTKQRDVSTGKMTAKKIDGSKLDFVIIEGLYSLHAPLAKLGDIRIGVQASLGQQFLVRSSRDIVKRKREPTEVARKFAERAPYQKRFVLPTLQNAEMVIDTETSGSPRDEKIFGKWLSEIKTTPEKQAFLGEIGLDHFGKSIEAQRGTLNRIRKERREILNDLKKRVNTSGMKLPYPYWEKAVDWEMAHPEAKGYKYEIISAGTARDSIFSINYWKKRNEKPVTYKSVLEWVIPPNGKKFEVITNFKLVEGGGYDMDGEFRQRSHYNDLLKRRPKNR